MTYCPRCRGEEIQHDVSFVKRAQWFKSGILHERNVYRDIYACDDCGAQWHFTMKHGERCLIFDADTAEPIMSVDQFMIFTKQEAS